MIQKVLHFFTRDIWRLRASKMRDRRGFFLRSLRIFILSLREFANDQCTLRASALTVYSLLSIVPVFAMAFGLAKGFGLDKLLREKLLENTQGQQEVMTRLIEFSENLLMNTKGGVVAGVGLALLFWSVIKVLGNVESAFNSIWGIKKGRSLGKKFTDYISLMLIVPLFFIVASSATVFIATEIALLTSKIMLGPFGTLILVSIKILPFMVFWGLLTFIYIFLPNGRVRFSSALLGGVVAGTVYQMVQWAYIHFQIGASNAGAVYGTFAALPLFLIWLQMSWLIVLYGAELAFAHQNEDRYEFEQETQNATERFKKILALEITQLCVKRFVAGEPPISVEEIASRLEIPIRLARELLARLTKARLLAELEGENDRDDRYQPARDVSGMTIQLVIREMENAGTEEVPVAETPELDQLREALRAFDAACEKLPENILLKDSSHRASRPTRAS